MKQSTFVEFLLFSSIQVNENVDTSHLVKEAIHTIIFYFLPSFFTSRSSIPDFASFHTDRA